MMCMGNTEDNHQCSTMFRSLCNWYGRNSAMCAWSRLLHSESVQDKRSVGKTTLRTMWDLGMLSILQAGIRKTTDLFHPDTQGYKFGALINWYKLHGNHQLIAHLSPWNHQFGHDSTPSSGTLQLIHVNQPLVQLQISSWRNPWGLPWNQQQNLQRKAHDAWENDEIWWHVHCVPMIPISRDMKMDTLWNGDVICPFSTNHTEGSLFEKPTHLYQVPWHQTL